MKLLVLISVACLGLLTQVTLAQNNTEANTTLNITTTSSNNTAEGNSTMTAFDSNSTSADNQMEVIVANNTTVETGNSSNVNQTDSEPSNVLQQPHNASEYNMTMFGFSSDCAVIVKNCYEQNASDEFEQFLYCEAFEKSSQCVAENITSGWVTLQSKPIQLILSYFTLKHHR